jgi:hypothetical protein
MDYSLQHPILATSLFRDGSFQTADTLVSQPTRVKSSNHIFLLNNPNPLYLQPRPPQWLESTYTTPPQMQFPRPPSNLHATNSGTYSYYTPNMVSSPPQPQFNPYDTPNISFSNTLSTPPTPPLFSVIHSPQTWHATSQIISLEMMWRTHTFPINPVHQLPAGYQMQIGRYSTKVFLASKQ